MGLLSWLVVGVLAGWIANMLMGKGSSGLIGNLILGVIGAFVGGFLMSFLNMGGVNGISVWSIIVATLGACVLIFLGRLINKR